MKKKILLMLAICIMLFALALTLAACDTDADTGATTTTSGTEDGGATTTTTTTTTTTAAQSLKRTYTIDGNLIATQTVPNGDTTTPHPAVPAKAHYDGVWELLSADGNNEYYYAKYTPTNYTVTFVANGETVDTQTYTVENKSIVEPAVPDAPYGYYEIERTAWGDYTLDGGNKTVNAIYSCETQAEYALSGSTYYVSGYNKIIDGMIEILSEYNGKPVTSISEDAFRGCTSLTSIAIPSSVKSIGNDAFEDCTSLNGVYISDIAAWCNISFGTSSTNPLYYAKNLYLNGELVTDLIIPDSVTSISYRAFYGCTSLTSITIPSSVTIIDDYAFSGCSNLNGVYISDIAAWCNISFTYDSANPLYYAKNLYLNGELVTNLVIPDSVTSIGDSAFEGCTSLTSVTFGENSQLTSIGNYAFYKCTSLNDVYISDIAAWCNISFGGYSANPLWNAENLYLNGELVTDLIIPDGVTSIGDSAFYKCTNLRSITIPSSVASIGSYAFRDCTSLESVTFGENSQLTSIGSFAFLDCTSLESVTFGENSQLTSIDSSAFRNCANLKSIEIPSSVTSIGDDAFRGCTSLESITLPFVGATLNGTSNTHFGYIFGASYSGDNDDYVPSSLKTVIIMGGSSIGDSAFRYCTSLASITIPSSVTSIGDLAFDNCTSLESVTFGENSQLTSIGHDAFSDCTSLTSITIPSSVISIGYQAFFDCTGLSSVIFENPDGWRRGASSGTAITGLSDASTAAKYLRSTYYNYSWKRS